MREIILKNNPGNLQEEQKNKRTYAKNKKRKNKISSRFVKMCNRTNFIILNVVLKFTYSHDREAQGNS